MQLRQIGLEHQLQVTVFLVHVIGLLAIQSFEIME